ncbi:hypothetical protein [Kitasatospora acidiphila]|nr:hypothetical protein [Kitasatospora acidiphila]
MTTRSFALRIAALTAMAATTLTAVPGTVHAATAQGNPYHGHEQFLDEQEQQWLVPDGINSITVYLWSGGGGGAGGASGGGGGGGEGGESGGGVTGNYTGGGGAGGAGGTSGAGGGSGAFVQCTMDVRPGELFAVQVGGGGAGGQGGGSVAGGAGGWTFRGNGSNGWNGQGGGTGNSGPLQTGLTGITDQMPPLYVHPGSGGTSTGGAGGGAGGTESGATGGQPSGASPGGAGGAADQLLCGNSEVTPTVGQVGGQGAPGIRGADQSHHYAGRGGWPTTSGTGAKGVGPTTLKLPDGTYTVPANVGVGGNGGLGGNGGAGGYGGTGFQGGYTGGAGEAGQPGTAGGPGLMVIAW